MVMTDYLIVILYLFASFGIAIYYSKRAGKSTNEFFLSGRNLPWYLAGLSMVATTFAADTPLAVTELVAKNGISGNWIWWNFVFGGLLTVFFFAKLWRRAGIMTEAEFAEIRYSGKPAKFLRGFRAFYLGLFLNVVIIAWVNRAMVTILTGIFGISESTAFLYVFLCMLLVSVYSALSGLWGVVVTDAFQFVIAMVGCIVLAIIVVNSSQVGGIDGLTSKLPEHVFNFFPSISVSYESAGHAASITIFSFLAYVGIQWWASWYPGSEPGGGGYVAQRMMSAKNEKHALYSTLFFQVAHYAIRPWPWILVALSVMVLYPELKPEEARIGFVYAIRDFMPAGLKGLIVAAFFAAYMSTIATQLNWGSSYILNDFYRRFLEKNRSEGHYVLMSRIITIVLMLIAMLVTLQVTRISGAWEFIIECGAGFGLVLILRWYWWRINAWSEISAMITPFILLPILKYYSVGFPLSLYFLVGITTAVWISVTFLTKPTEEPVLISFYKRVYPGGVFWKHISDSIDIPFPKVKFSSLFYNWLLGVVFVYSSLFGVGKLIFKDYLYASIYLTAAIISVIIFVRSLRD